VNGGGGPSSSASAGQYARSRQTENSISSINRRPGPSGEMHLIEKGERVRVLFYLLERAYAIAWPLGARERWRVRICTLLRSKNRTRLSLGVRAEEGLAVS
jgi:hypothetical protein